MLNLVAPVMTLVLVVTSVTGRDDDFRNAQFGWALVSKGSTIATSTDELSRLEEWTFDGDRVLYARFGEDEYLIHDGATLDRVDQLVAPIRKLGERAREIMSRGARPD